MTLRDRITEDMKAAMRAKDAPRLSTVRLLLAAMKQREVDERIVLDDAAVMGIVEKMIKQRRESIAQFEKAGRNDLVDNEKFELGVLASSTRNPLPSASARRRLPSNVITSVFAARCCRRRCTDRRRRQAP